MDVVHLFININEEAGTEFITLKDPVMLHIQNIILIFPDERPVFLREVNNNMYSVSAYFFHHVSKICGVAIGFTLLVSFLVRVAIH